MAASPRIEPMGGPIGFPDPTSFQSSVISVHVDKCPCNFIVSRWVSLLLSLLFDLTICSAHPISNLNPQPLAYYMVVDLTLLRSSGLKLGDQTSGDRVYVTPLSATLWWVTLG